VLERTRTFYMRCSNSRAPRFGKARGPRRIECLTGHVSARSPLCTPTGMASDHAPTYDMDVRSIVADLKRVADLLPPCGDEAKIRGLLWRITDELAEGSDVHESVRRLAAVAEEKAQKDPWLHVYRLSQLLRSRVEVR